MARTTRSDASRDAVIGRTARVRARVSGDGDLVVEGTLEGDVTLRGNLTVSEGARATSNVDADAVTIQGELEGDIRARGVVHVGAKARVQGNVQGTEVSIDEGAEFAGRLDADFELPAELGGGASGGRRR